PVLDASASVEVHQERGVNFGCVAADSRAVGTSANHDIGHNLLLAGEEGRGALSNFILQAATHVHSCYFTPHPCGIRSPDRTSALEWSCSRIIAVSPVAKPALPLPHAYSRGFSPRWP